MSRFINLIFVISITCINVSAQNNPAIKADSIIFEKLVNDYGTIIQGSDGSCEFKFMNKGKSALVLTNVQASCGCTVPTWPKEPVLPGKSATIKVSYNTNNQGTFIKTITVFSNALNSPVILTIKGKVAPKQ